MKTLPLAVALLLTFAAAACSDSPTDSNNNNTSTTFTNKTSGTINGDAWTAVNLIGTRNAVSGIVAVTFIAYGPEDSNINFGIVNASTTSFTVADGTANQAHFKYKNVTYGDNESGTIKIDAISDKGMRGSFNITAKTTTGVSGTAVGTFEVAF